MSARPWEQDKPKTRKPSGLLPATLRKIRRFFEVEPEQQAFEANRKGDGFRLSRLMTGNSPRDQAQRKIAIAGAVIAGIALAAVLVILLVGTSPEFAMTITAMIALTGFIAWDIVSRRLWEKSLTLKLDEITARHDRLVRETARNRNDIAFLKEGLGSMARSVEEQGRGLSPSVSTEARMIETIVSQLGALGEKPRAAIESRHDSDILELEMAPPPARPAPATALDDEINPDFSKFTDTIVADLLRHAVRNDSIDVFTQPVVSLPQRKPRLLETYARIRAGGGGYIPAERYLEIGRKQGLLPALDNLLLLRCLQTLRDRRSENQMPFIINVSGNTLDDRNFMNDLVAFLSANHKMAEHIIFEMPQGELEQGSETLRPLLTGLGKLGVRFSMDRVRNRKIDISLLKSCNIRFIKMDSGWLLNEGRSKSGFSRVVRMKKQLDAAGIDLIVERIEKEDTLRELLDYNVDYGQGYLFGKPDHLSAYHDRRAAA